MADSFQRKYSKRIMFERILWNIVWTIFIRPFPRAIVSRWEIFILKSFGAKIGKSCTIYSSARILIPRNLIMGNNSCIANNTYIQNSAISTIKDNVIISQGTYICCGTHDYTKSSFENIRKPITIDNNAWIAAQCFIGPGVVIREGAVVAARAVVVKDVEPWTVVGGNPAKFIKKREIKDA